MPLKNTLKYGLIALLSFILVIPSGGLQAEHVVSSADLQAEIAKASAHREQNLSSLRNFLSSEPAQTVIKQMKADSTQVMEALPQLSDKELDDLAIRAGMAQQNFAGGYHEHELITILIVILLVVAIVVIAQGLD